MAPQVFKFFLAQFKHEIFRKAIDIPSYCPFQLFGLDLWPKMTVGIDFA